MSSLAEKAGLAIAYAAILADKTSNLFQFLRSLARPACVPDTLTLQSRGVRYSVK